MEWYQATLIALPPVLWVIIGMGLPWSLVILPRRDWADRAMVACCALLFGPALLTVWMFVLGTLGMNDDPNAGATLNPMQTFPGEHVGGMALLTPANILLGTAIIALVGGALAWRKWRTTDSSTPTKSHPLQSDEKLLIALIVVATLARWVLTAYLLFGAWDELWVYGYQGRVYALLGYIPADIGYYPQFLPLQYAYTQILAGEINDHTARVVVPFLQIGSILAAYLLGSRLFNRRTGIFTAALWALYPHFGIWTRIGDLEIPVTFAFTGTVAFFLMAWTVHRDDSFYRQRYALIAGLFFGVAMWTKPTAGAFIWGAVLVVVAHLVHTLSTNPTLNPSPYTGRDLSDRRDSRSSYTAREGFTARFRPRFEVAVITGLACMPLGALWYVRNILIGHDALVFPPSVWLTRAERSGAEFGWILLATGVLLAYLYLAPLAKRPDLRRIVPGVGLIALGVVPSIIDPHRMIWWEWLAFFAGYGLIGVELWRYARANAPDSVWAMLSKLGWAGLIVLPYFVTWFYSYSYHYRLSFAIVPVMILPTAVILAHWFSVERVRAWRSVIRVGYLVVVFAVALPGVMIFAYDENAGWEWFQNDIASQEGSALIRTVRTIEAYQATHDTDPVIIAPGAQRLPFYFPTLDIRVADPVRSYDRVNDADLFIDGADAIVVYTGENDVAPFQNQFLSGIRRPELATEIAFHEDGSFFYEIFDLHIETRFERPPVSVEAEREVIVGGFAEYIGHSLSDTTLTTGNAIQMEIVWEVLSPPDADYTVFVHLIDPAQGVDIVLNGWDGPVGRWESGYYATRFWEPGEYIIDRRTLQLPADHTIPPGDYRLRIGFYNENGRVPLTVNGETQDGFFIETPLTVP